MLLGYGKMCHPAILPPFSQKQLVCFLYACMWARVCVSPSQGFLHIYANRSKWVFIKQETLETLVS